MLKSSSGTLHDITQLWGFVHYWKRRRRTGVGLLVELSIWL